MGAIEKDLGTLKVNIKRLIKLRGKTLRDLSKEMNVPYTGLSRLLCDSTYETPNGTMHKFKLPHIQKAIADFLGVPYYDLWYKEGNKIITALIEIEAAKAVRILIEQNRTLYKPKEG